MAGRLPVYCRRGLSTMVRLTRFSAARRSTRKQQAALVLDKLLPQRRRKWAELIGWTALTLKADEASQGWEAFAVVARDLLADRPLTDFPVMRDIAGRTVAAFADHCARG